MSAAEIESETPIPSSSSSSSSSSSNSTTTTVNTPTIGLILSNTEAIRSFLNLSSSSSSSLNLSENLRQSALSLSSQSSIPYQSLRSIWAASDPTTRPSLSLLLRGSSFLFTSPEPREKSEELKARLRKLEELAERKAYAELVKDITPKKPNEPFSSYKDQLGFGLHVVVIMFTGFLFGYFAFNALFDHNPVMSTAGGILGLVFGMLVETLLFIIRTNDFSDKSPSSRSPSNLSIKKNQ